MLSGLFIFITGRVVQYARLARLAARIIEQHGGIVDLASMLNFDCPSYNQDIEEKEGLPAGAAELRKRIEANDAFVIASPEYNGSMPGLMKNVIDWVSRCGKQSGLITLLQEQNQIWIYFSLRIPLTCLYAEA